MTIRHIHSPTHPSNSDTINTQFVISTVAVIVKYRKTSCAAHKVQKSGQCTQQGYHCFTHIKNRYGNAQVNINTYRPSHTVVIKSVQPKEK